MMPASASAWKEGTCTVSSRMTNQLCKHQLRLLPFDHKRITSISRVSQLPPSSCSLLATGQATARAAALELALLGAVLHTGSSVCCRHTTARLLWHYPKEQLPQPLRLDSVSIPRTQGTHRKRFKDSGELFCSSKPRFLSFNDLFVISHICPRRALLLLQIIQSKY